MKFIGVHLPVLALAAALAACEMAGAKVSDPGMSSGGQTESGGHRGAITLPEPFFVPEPGTPIPPAGDTPESCSHLRVTLRDFKMDDPSGNFERAVADDLGLVAQELGPDQKPVYAKPGPTVTIPGGKAAFDQLYRDVPGVNMTFQAQLQLEPMGNGSYSFDSQEFFPLDGLGFGNGWASHNYSFTTEIHAKITYKGGEKFKFRGDDDVFVFVDRKLALDLGGVHPPKEGVIDFDTLGLTVGQEYQFDIFQAERHTGGSSFRIETTIACFRSVVIL